MSTIKRETKVSAAAAEDEARSLLETLRREPAASLDAGRELNDRYSASPRKAILSHTATILPQMQPPVLPDAIRLFL